MASVNHHFERRRARRCLRDVWHVRYKIDGELRHYRALDPHEIMDHVIARIGSIDKRRVRIEMSLRHVADIQAAAE